MTPERKALLVSLIDACADLKALDELEVVLGWQAEMADTAEARALKRVELLKAQKRGRK